MFNGLVHLLQEPDFAICSSSTEGTVQEHRDRSTESAGTVALSVLGAVQGQKTFLPQRINAGDGAEIC